MWSRLRPDKEDSKPCGLWPRSLPGAPPRGPRSRVHVSEVIKFRVATGEKLMFVNAARNSGTTLSDLLRRAGKAAIAGRIASRSVLTDLVYIRSMANRLDALATIPGGDPAEISAAIKNAAESLRAIAARHLTAGQ